MDEKQDTERKPALTPEEYVKRVSDCPACGAKNAASLSDAPEIEGSQVWANCHCEECGAHWTEYYNLAGYDNLNENS
jgi:transcription elongation factor Elf1